MAKKYITLFGIRIPVIGTIKDDENGQPLIVLEKKNTGRKPTRLKAGRMIKPVAHDPGDGIWHDEMTEAQKKEYGFMKSTTKKGAKNED